MSESNKQDTSKEPEIRYVPVQFIEGYTPQGTQDELEIDLTELLKRLWDHRLKIVKIASIFALIGILYAIFYPNEYTSTVKLLPEAQQTNNLGRFGGLAAQFGLGGASTGATNDVLPPQMYPEILTNTDFLIDIVSKKVYFEEIQDSITIQEFYNKYQDSNAFIDYTIRLPFSLLGLLRTAPQTEPILIDDSQEYRRIHPSLLGATNGVRNAIVFNQDQTTGVLTINATTQHPEVTVQLVNYVTQSLSEYLITYRTEKSRQNLLFLEQRQAEAQTAFEKEQERLAAFRDQNQGNLTAAARTTEQNIQSEYNVKLNVYNSLTEQLEQARLKLQQDTPVVSVLQQSYYPNNFSSPNRILIILSSIILGLIVGSINVITSPFYQTLKVKLGRP